MKHVGMFLALTLLPISVEAVPRKDPVEPAVVEGVYTLHYAKRPDGEAIGEMTAMACSDGTFMIHGDGWCALVSSSGGAGPTHGASRTERPA